MGYKRTRDNYVYVVSWDSDGIIKIGSSAAQRWRSFVIRGGRLVRLGLEGGMRYPQWPGEMQYHAAALTFANQAFPSRLDAVPYLGGSGGGWLECYRLGGLSAEAFVSRCSDLMLKHDARALPPSIRPKWPAA